MLKSKKLRQNKVRLEASARSKLAELTDDMDEVAARAIEDAHTAILADIAELDKQIRSAVEDEDEGKRKRGKDASSDEDDDEDEDDETDEADEPKRSLKSSVVAEMVLIDQQARNLDIDIGLADAITRCEKPDSMRKRMFAKLAEKSAGKGPRGSNSPEVHITRDEREGRSAAMELALITRTLASRGNDGIAYKPKDPREAAFVEKHRKQSEQYMGMGIVDIAAACIDYRGRGSYLTARDTDEILTRAFNSTSDFPAIFQNVLNKSLQARYELMTPTYRRLAAQRNFKDFRPHPQIRAGEFPQLQPVTQTGELVYGTSNDNYENVSVVPYGVVFSISRQMLVNDDLGAIDQILGSAGDTVLIFENTTFFNMFLSAAGAGPTLTQDNTAVFAAGHNNLAAAGTAITVSSLGSARAALRVMKSISGLYINVPPAIILTGPAKETEADQIVTSITPTLVGSVNPFSGRLESISDSNIPSTNWYIGTDPSRVPCFVYGFLNGANGPRTRTFEPFGVQGVKISLEHDFGCGAIDYRGMYRNPGA
jgi:hypothetical protein